MKSNCTASLEQLQQKDEVLQFPNVACNECNSLIIDHPWNFETNYVFVCCQYVENDVHSGCTHLCQSLDKIWRLTLQIFRIKQEMFHSELLASPVMFLKSIENLVKKKTFPVFASWCPTSGLVISTCTCARVRVMPRMPRITPPPSSGWPTIFMVIFI